jgi:hypothetical protein
MIDRATRFWGEGSIHGFPPCCKARFIVSVLRPRFIRHRLAPNFFTRWKMNLSLRHSLADGMVPCEYHALKYLVTGDKTGWRKNRETTETCCEVRRDLEDSGIATLKRTQIKFEDVDGGKDLLLSDETYWVWMLNLPVQEEEGRPEHEISVHNCPWCGTPLE